MGKKSITKGSNFERKVAKILSGWVGFKLVRTPMSGAWSGCSSDIWQDDSKQIFQLAVECKCTEGWSFHQIMQGIGPFFDWIDQAIGQAQPGQVPVLIFSANRRPVYVAFPVSAIPVGCAMLAKLFVYCAQDTFVIMVLDQFIAQVGLRDIRLGTSSSPVQTGYQG